MATLTLQEALDRRGELSVDELNSLFPQTVAAVLAMEDITPGATIGDWTVIENDEGHRGFETEFPGLMEEMAQLFRVLQLEPGYLSVSIQAHAGVFDLQGIYDVREGAETEAATNETTTVEAELGTVVEQLDGDDEPTPEAMEAVFDRMSNLTLLFVCWILNTDLLDFITGEEPTSHRDVMAEMRRDLENMMLGQPTETQGGGKKRRRRKDKPQE